MNTGTNGATQQLGAIFVDGLYLFGSAQSLTMEDIERVEVIKGPQNAFFGRATFGGAVNFITREPSDEFSGPFSATAESRDSYNAALSVEGPVNDWLSFRLSGSYNRVGGHYKTSDGGKLGQQETNVISGQFVATPGEGARIRVRHTCSWDSDGQQLVVNLNASDPLIEGNPAECLTGTLPFWCGQLPKLGDPGVPLAVLDIATKLPGSPFVNSTNPNLVADILAKNTSNPLVTIGFPLQDRLPSLSKPGLENRFHRTRVC